MKLGIFFLISLTAAAFCLNARADGTFDADLVKDGERTYVLNCSRCHGIRLMNSGYTFDLRQFPAGQRERFFNSIAKGKGNMPAWGDMLNNDQIAALWAYVQTEGKRQRDDGTKPNN